MHITIHHLQFIEYELNSNIDVEVEIDQSTRYAFTAFTIKNLEEIINSYKTTRECLSDTYFGSEGMVLVKEITR